MAAQDEPRALRHLSDRVIHTPHIAGFAPLIAERHLAVLLDNIGRFVQGRPLENGVNKGRWF